MTPLEANRITPVHVLMGNARRQAEGGIWTTMTTAQFRPLATFSPKAGDKMEIAGETYQVKFIETEQPFTEPLLHTAFIAK